MDLNFLNLGTLILAAPCCAFYGTRHRIYRRCDMDDTVFVCTLIWYHTHRQTHMTQRNQYIYTHKYMLAPAVNSADQLPVLYWIHNFLIQKFTIYFTRSTMSLLFKNYWLICSIIPVLWIRSIYVVPKILVILWRENGKVFLYNFFENPKRTQRLADLNPFFLCGQSFCNLCFGRLSYIYCNTALVMIMMENWEYESRVKVITSRQPYWYCNGFLPVRCDLLSFSVPWGTEKIPELLLARGNQYPIL